MEINGYTLTSALKNENSGFSTWGFCQRNGQEYFIKEFINPVHPGGDPYLSEALKQKKLQTCLKFEEKLTGLFSAVNRASNGNLVRIEDFFRHGSKYYVVTKKLTFAAKGLEEIASLPDVRKEFLTRLVLHTMMCMHNEGVVHGDIKAANILVHFDPYHIMAKVIDFDGGFFADNPPQEGDEITGDVAYLAPEVLQCMCGEFAPLSCKIDVFSLGVLLHQYWTGESPLYDTDRYDCIAEAMLCGGEVCIDGRIPKKISNIIHDMLQLNPWDRISMEEAYHRILEPEKIEEDHIRKNSVVIVYSKAVEEPIPEEAETIEETVEEPILEEPIPDETAEEPISEEAETIEETVEEPILEEPIPDETTEKVISEEAETVEETVEETVPVEAIPDETAEEETTEEPTLEETVSTETVPEPPAEEPDTKPALPELVLPEPVLPEPTLPEPTIPEPILPHVATVKVPAGESASKEEPSSKRPIPRGFHAPDEL